MQRPTFAPRGDRDAVEQGALLTIKFDADGLVPAIAQDVETGEVLMLAYMNADSLAMTIEKGEAVYWSRSRQELWHKGATSGQIQEVLELRVDCDQDAVLLRVRQRGGGACHTGAPTCFYRRARWGGEGDVALVRVGTA